MSQKVLLSWHLQFENITALRRVLATHSDLLNKDASLLPRLLPCIQEACRHSQSSLAKNALLCVGELFASEPPLLPASFDRGVIAALVAACLVQCSKSQPDGIRKAALGALEQLTRKWNSAYVPVLLVPAVLAYAAIKDQKDTPVAAVSNNETRKGRSYHIGEALGLLSASIDGQVSTRKSALKLICLTLAHSAGEAEYEAASKAIESLSQVRVDQSEEGNGAGSAKTQASLDGIAGTNLPKETAAGANQVDDDTSSSSSKKYPSGYAMVADLGFVPKAKPSLKPRLMGSFSLKPTTINSKKKKKSADGAGATPDKKAERPSARRGDLEVSELQRLTAQRAAAAKEEEEAKNIAAEDTDTKEQTKSEVEDGSASNNGSFRSSAQGSMRGTSFNSAGTENSSSAGAAAATSPTTLSKRELGKEKLAAKKAAKAAAEEAKKAALRQAEADKKAELATRVSAASGVQRLSPSELRKGPMSFLPDKLAPWRGNGADQLNKERLLAKHKTRLADLKQAVEVAKIRVKEAKVAVKKAAKGAPKEMAKVALLEAQQSVKDAQEVSTQASSCRSCTELCLPFASLCA